MDAGDQCIWEHMASVPLTRRQFDGFHVQVVQQVLEFWVLAEGVLVACADTLIGVWFCKERGRIYRDVHAFEI